MPDFDPAIPKKSGRLVMDLEEKGLRAAFWIDLLHLNPHPEGGYFRETYRCPKTLQIKSDVCSTKLTRSLGTAIYYLLVAGDFSALHRLAADEMWHHYQGGGVEIHSISPRGDYQKFLLGTSGKPTELPQVVIPAGYWFGACLAPGVDFALMGCTVTPGFDFEDFELGRRAALMDQFPQHADLIKRMTR